MTSMAFLAVKVRCSRRPFTCADKTDQSAVESAWRTAPSSSAVFGGVTPYPCKTVLRDKPSLSGCTYASPLPVTSEAAAAARNLALTCHQPDVSLRVKVFCVATPLSTTQPLIESGFTTTVSRVSPLLVIQARISAVLKALRRASKPA